MAPSTIGPYKIERELGRGGMGEVYLATDTRLDRQVAIKALPAHLAQDADRLARFQREAKVLASLNHPGIGAIYGLEESGGHRYLVLEFVEGQTLSDRLAKGPIPIEEALALAKQIAEALEVAHEKGVIHRDLKPANVMLTDEGAAKVLDFGLARTEDGTPSSSVAYNGPDSPTRTSPARLAHSPTIPGVIMGTAGYMSPEQARGKPVDKRSDIFSFGCVLYEMLTGSMPFRGETVADSIGATLHKDMDLGLLPPATPRRVRDLMTTCLAKDRKNRLRDIGDARIELERAMAEPRDVANVPASLRPWMIASSVLLVVASVGWVWVASRPATSQARKSPTLELAIPMPNGHEVVGPIAISRDGKRVVFRTDDETGDSQLSIRELHRSEFIKVPGSREASSPSFSPDGRSVIFFGLEGLYRAPVDGGRPILVAKLTHRSATGTCVLDDGSIIYSTGVDSPLWRIPPGDGKAVALTDLSAIPGTYAHVWPQPIPGTNKMLLVSWAGNGVGGSRITDTQTGAVHQIMRDQSFDKSPPARWVASGHLILGAGDTLFATSYDPEAGGNFDGYERNRILTSVAHLGTSTRSVFDVSDDGMLAYVPAEPANRRLVWVDASGATEYVTDANALSGFVLRNNLAISPDGTQAAFGGGGDIGVVDFARGIARRITFDDEANDMRPVWSSDGSRVLFASNRENRWAIWSVSANGSDDPELVYKCDRSAYATSVSPDGMICVEELTSDAGTNIMIIEKEGNARPLLQTRYNERSGSFSTDGRWVAYQSNISGRDEIYVIGSSGDGQPVQISTGGGKSPKWGPLGKSLYYRAGRSIMRIEIADGRTKGVPERVFKGPVLESESTYSLASDETRVLAVEVSEESIGREIRIITNFFDRIREVAGPGSRKEARP